MAKKMKKMLSVFLSLMLACTMMVSGFTYVNAEEDTDDNTEEVTTLDEETTVSDDEETLEVVAEDEVTEEEPSEDEEDYGIQTYAEEPADEEEPAPEEPATVAEDELKTLAAESYPIELYAEVTDAGQVIYKMVIDYGDGYEVSEVTTNTYTVHATADTKNIHNGTEEYTGDYDGVRTIVKVETDGQYVTVYFDENDGYGATLSYLVNAARNYPADLSYTVTQNSPITLTDAEGVSEEVTADYTWDNTYYDAEVSKFKSVIVDGGINYLFYEPSSADTLIVWFHGNGEGDYNSSNNNVAQAYGNRGTVAWATDEAQSIFGGAYVMSFQAPDAWYYNYENDKALLKMAYNEIEEVINQYGIKNTVVTGCSAGGYMSTSMLIEYPDLFDVAMINCPALDVAEARGGVYLTDEQLESIADSDTAIWLVQGTTDASVATPDCSVRLFNALTGNTLTYEGNNVVSYSDDLTVTKVPQSIASDYTTYETSDSKYLISLYETVAADDTTYLQFAEDYDFDGIDTLVEYSSHWSWIYTLRNNPTNAEGTHIWNWAASQLNTKSDSETFDYDLYAEVTDAGQVIYKMVIDYGESYKVSGVTKDTYTVHANASTEAILEGTEDFSYGDYDGDRTIVKVEIDGQYVTVYFDENDGYGATLAYLSSARNYPADLTYTVTQNSAIKATAADGRELDDIEDANYTWDRSYYDDEAAKFKSVIVDGGINYQFYAPSSADTLIVWFHGNGEGDYLSSNNNVAQVYGNRGTVAWATDEAQSIFGGAYVMSFQAPDTWYYNYSDGLLEMAYNEIEDVVSQYGIKNLVVSGCSAGGYMSTSMLVEYPDLFDVAMINCPALDVAEARGGVYLTDEQLESIADSDTAIWLVQGVTDGTVATQDCSVRLFNALTGDTLIYDEGTNTVSATDDLTVTRVDNDSYNSDYYTYETADEKYLISLYDTTDNATLMFGEDYNFDGVDEYVEYSNHWSWIYTLRNNPTNAEGTHIWNWAADQLDSSSSSSASEKGSAELDAQPTATTTGTDEDETGSTVKTNDNTNMIVYGLLLLVAATGLVYGGYRYRRKED